MKIIVYEDKDGWLRRSLVKEDMLPEQASQGIPRNPPDLRQLDCEAIFKEINNLLVERGLFTVSDLNQNPGVLQNTIVSTFYREILELYKNHFQTGLNGGNAPAEKIRPTEVTNAKSS